MSNDPRDEELLRLLEKREYLSVHALAQEMHLSESTVRRQLSRMAKSGLVRRTYGGVTLGHSQGNPFSMRNESNTEEKRRLAQKACALIPEGGVIFLDSSSTVVNMPEFMKKLNNITVVTNGFEVCRQLMNQTQDLYFVGGYVDKRDEACRGKYALQQLKMMHFDVGFFACSGLGEDGVLSGYTDSGSLIVQTAIESCDKRVFLCDSSKLFLRRVHTICSLTDIDEVIILEPLPEKLQRMVGINRPRNTEEVK